MASMLDTSDLGNELLALKSDVSRLLKTTSEKMFDGLLDSLSKSLKQPIAASATSAGQEQSTKQGANYANRATKTDLK